MSCASLNVKFGISDSSAVPKNDPSHLPEDATRKRPRPINSTGNRGNWFTAFGIQIIRYRLCRFCFAGRFSLSSRTFLGPLPTDLHIQVKKPRYQKEIQYSIFRNLRQAKCL